jgi:predicted GNAT family acetyltransferase
MTAQRLEQHDGADDVRVVDNPGAHRFEVWVGDELAGFATYRRLEGTTYAVDHTEVGPPFEGRGLADRLVADALDEVRSRGGSLLPYCPYVRAWLGRHPAYVDLVPADERERFGLA